ncbi:MAG: hypothetical protein ACKOAY_05130 [Haliscomenobacter sp.]
MMVDKCNTPTLPGIVKNGHSHDSYQQHLPLSGWAVYYSVALEHPTIRNDRKDRASLFAPDNLFHSLYAYTYRAAIL